jgi:hypothetical protein
MIHAKRVLCAAGLIGLASCNAPVSGGTPGAANTGESPSAPLEGSSASAAASVLLFADASEAESSCGCGQIIRTVREARERGVVVREVSPDNPGDVAKRYKITVAPTVLMLDGNGEAMARHEGESKETVAAVVTDLDRLAKKGGR